MAKQNNTKVEENKAPAAEVELDAMFDNFVEEQVGFAPYWEPEEGKRFYAILAGVDMADPNFLRYSFTAAKDTECFTGPADEQVPVTVHEGETFTCSVYAQLRDRFDEYLGLLAEGVIIPILVTCIGKSDKKTQAGFNFWKFKISVSQENKQLLLKYRSQKLAELRAASQPGKVHAAIPVVAGRASVGAG